MHTKQKHCTICIGHHDTKASTNNVNKTYVLLQLTGGKDEPNRFHAEIATDITTCNSERKDT